MTSWTFLTNHAAVLLCVARDPGLRIRDVAERVGITERAAQRIVNDLVAEGYLTRRRVGSRNLYELHPERPFRLALVQHREIGALLALIEEDGRGMDSRRADFDAGIDAPP